MKFQDIYALAKQHVAEGEMSSSAQLCLDDAMRCWKAGAHESAKRWARKSLSYSVGICHPDYIATNDTSNIGE